MDLPDIRIGRWTFAMALVGLSLACGGIEPSGGSPLCAQACAKLDRCGLQPEHECLQQCDQASENDMRTAIDLSCRELEAIGGGGGGGGGGECRASGVDDCPGAQMCCAPGGGRAARRGESGTCMQAGTCNMPSGGY